jgi:hypothetical protein
MKSNSTDWKFERVETPGTYSVRLKRKREVVVSTAANYQSHWKLPVTSPQSTTQSVAHTTSPKQHLSLKDTRTPEQLYLDMFVELVGLAELKRIDSSYEMNKRNRDRRQLPTPQELLVPKLSPKKSETSDSNKEI